MTSPMTVHHCPIIISDQLAQLLTQEEIIHFINAESFRMALGQQAMDMPFGVLDLLYDYDYFRDNNSFGLTPQRDEELALTPDLEHLLHLELTEGLYSREGFEAYPVSVAIALGMPEGPEHNYITWIEGYFFH